MFREKNEQEAAGLKETGTRAKEFQTGNILTIGFAHLMHDIYSSFVAPLLPLLIEKFSLSYTMAGLLVALHRGPALLNPIIGILADRLPVRYIVILSPFVTAITMSLLGIAPVYGVLVILVLIMGFSSAFFHVPTPVLVKQVAGSRVGKGMSIFMLGGELARSLGPLVILGAVSLWTLEGTWRLIPFAAATSIFLFIKLKDVRLHKVDVEDHEKRTAWETFKRYLPLFTLVIIFTMFIALMKSAVTVYLPTYLTSRGADLWLSGISLSVIQFAGAGGTLLSGTISDSIGRKGTLLIIAIASPLLMWLFILAEGIWVFPILILLGIFLFATNPVMLALIQDLRSDKPAFLNGVYMGISFGISSGIVLLIGLMGDGIGLDLTFKICASVAPLGALAVWKMK